MARWRNLLGVAAAALTVATIGTIVHASPVAAAPPGPDRVVGGTRATQGEFRPGHPPDRDQLHV